MTGFLVLRKERLKSCLLMLRLGLGDGFSPRKTLVGKNGQFLLKLGHLLERWMACLSREGWSNGPCLLWISLSSIWMGWLEATESNRYQRRFDG